ncbi:MAG TPA: PDZ domain-containing protein [Gemmatimonadota bacterium]|nr:PDZ domain-containing protein [Gemmatimonadota bacterium]
MSLARSTGLLPAFLGLAALSAPAHAAPAAQDTGTVTVSGGEPSPYVVRPTRTRVIVNGPQDAGYLGVRVTDVDSAAVSRLDLPELRGARVTSVEDSSPAAKAGLRADDVILDFDGEPVRSVATLTRMVRETPPDRSVQLRVVRDGKTRQVTVVTGEASSRFGRLGAMVAPDVRLRMSRLVNDSTRERLRVEVEKAREEARKAGEEMRRSWRSGDLGPHGFLFELGGPGRLGVSLRPLGDQLGAYFGVKDGEGVLVGSVESGSAAEKAGLKAGDVIVEVGGEKVEGPGDVIEAVHDADAGPITVKVMRDRKERTVTVDLPERRRAAPGQETSFRLRVRPDAPLPPFHVAPPEVHVAPPEVPAFDVLPPLPAPPAPPAVDRYI